MYSMPSRNDIVGSGFPFSWLRYVAVNAVFLLIEGVRTRCQIGGTPVFFTSDVHFCECNARSDNETTKAGLRLARADLLRAKHSTGQCWWYRRQMNCNDTASAVLKSTNQSQATYLTNDARLTLM